jgi:glycosyltransferase involved in cell wall biosynthesis
VFVGEGSERGKVIRHADSLGLSPAATFTGFISEPEKIAWLQRAAVVVNTSEKEGWGMTVVEGNACGAPSVCSDVAGLRDSVRDGETGLLYPYGDRARLADAVAGLLEDPRKRTRLSLAARQWAECFNWVDVAADVEGLLEAAITAAVE